MQSKLISNYEDKIIITSDDDSQHFLSFCLKNNIPDYYITQRDHLFVILDGIPFGGRWGTGIGINFNNIDNKLISKPREVVWYSEFKKEMPKIYDPSFEFFKSMYGEGVSRELFNEMKVKY